MAEAHIPQPVNPGRTWLTIGLWIVVSAAYYLAYAHTFLNSPSLNDEGLAWYGALRVMQGERPLADFWAYPPGRYWITAAAMNLFGVTLMTERAVLALLMAVRNALAFTVARRVMPRGPAIALTLTIMLVPGPWHKVYYSLLMFAQLLVLMHYLHKPGAWRAMFCGVAAGIAFYLRQDSAAYGLIACAMLMSLAQLAEKHWKTWVKHGLLTACGFAVVLLPLAVMYADDAALVLRRLGPDPVAVAEVVYERMNFMAPDRLLRFAAAHFTDWPNGRFLNGLLPIILMGIAGAGLVSCAGSIKKISRDKLIWIAVVVWSCLSLMKVYKQPNFEAALMAGQGAMLIGFALVCTHNWRTLNTPKRVGWVTALVVLGFMWVHLLVLAVRPIEGIESGAWPTDYEHMGVFDVPRAHLHLDAQQAATLQQLVEIVQDHSAPDETIYAWQNPMLYLLCERENATLSDSIVPPIRLTDWDKHFIEVFTQRPPTVQIVSTRLGWIKRFEAYSPQLQGVMFRGYSITDDLGEYLILQHTGEGDAREMVMSRVKQNVKQR